VKPYRRYAEYACERCGGRTLWYLENADKGPLEKTCECTEWDTTKKVSMISSHVLITFGEEEE